MLTIADLIATCRVLLLDQVEPYRYSNAELIMALNLAMSEAYRLRPDFFVRQTMPIFAATDLAKPHTIPKGYESPFIYYMTGYAQLRDAEDVQDARAGVFLNKFTAQLLGLA